MFIYVGVKYKNLYQLDLDALETFTHFLFAGSSDRVLNYTAA